MSDSDKRCRNCSAPTQDIEHIYCEDCIVMCRQWLSKEDYHLAVMIEQEASRYKKHHKVDQYEYPAEDNDLNDYEYLQSLYLAHQEVWI